MGAVVRIAVAEEVPLPSSPEKTVNMISRILCVALLSSVALAAPQYFYYPQHFAQQQLLYPHQQQLFHFQYPQQFQAPTRRVFLVQSPLFQPAMVPAAVNPEEGMLEEEVSAETRDSMDKQVIDEAKKMDKE